ncbi:urease accessory protein UreD [Streptomyces sp. NPDC049954]|uniref:urease accessory protein UreD n=1 Tax=Streptomyces sp. NPDC049954 TaxID=3155779 RepID=UPI0034466C08
MTGTSGPAGERYSGVVATARINAAPDGRGGTALPLLSGEGPLALRRTRAGDGGARVLTVGAMSGPLGGDHFTVRARVRPGARLTVGSVAATLALPGQAKGHARYDVRLDVAQGAELRWLPEQLIAAKGSDLRVTTRVRLERGARLVLREEQVLGRSAEEPGRLASRLTVHHDGSALLDQETHCGPGAPGGWDGPAVLAGLRTLGQLVVVAPEFEDNPVAARQLGPYAALMPLAGPAVLVTALAPDALRLRRLLDEAAQALGAAPRGGDVPR